MKLDAFNRTSLLSSWLIPPCSGGPGSNLNQGKDCYTEVLRTFSQFLHENAEMAPQIRHDSSRRVFYSPSGMLVWVLYAVRSPAGSPWLECGVVGDAIPCDRERERDGNLRRPF
jgi:hypothetical protein